MQDKKRMLHHDELSAASPQPNSISNIPSRPAGSRKAGEYPISKRDSRKAGTGNRYYWMVVPASPWECRSLNRL
ncbi:MAG: hypothetical protein WCI51_02095 [Lentisphaerota bacterium]